MYVVMGMLPGVRIGNVFRELGREERDEFRRGFKEAWLYAFLSLSSHLFFALGLVEIP